jgi:hypothetical protein
MSQVDEKLQFASPAWVESLKAILTALVAEHRGELEDVDFSICEVFTNVPPDGATSVWAAQIAQGTVRFFEEPIPADYEVRGDYEAVLPGAKLIYEGATEAELAAAGERRRQMVEAGRLTSKGDIRAMPKPVRRLLQTMHDRLARQTL